LQLIPEITLYLQGFGRRGTRCLGGLLLLLKKSSSLGMLVQKSLGDCSPFYAPGFQALTLAKPAWFTPSLVWFPAKCASFKTFGMGFVVSL
jgi:hypothetical protein